MIPSHGTEGKAPTRDEVVAWLVSRIALLVELPAQEIDLNKHLLRFGIDSIQVEELVGNLEEWLGRELPRTLIWEDTTVSSLAQCLCAPESSQNAETTGVNIVDFTPEQRAYMEIEKFASLGLGFLTAADEPLSGRSIRIKDKPIISFASCSYVGLEHDARLKEGVKDAVERFGSQFAYSRAFVQVPLYQTLEDLLEELFGMPVQIAQTTTLAHFAFIPLAVGPQDAIILDHQVHKSVQMAAHQAVARGTRLEVIPHNRMDLLEEQIRDLRGGHRRIWYMADGVYSMYGDLAPLVDLKRLLDEYDDFSVYIDDAHGMSWCGRWGRGTVVDELPMHPRMIVVTCLDKAFSAQGGVLLIPDPSLRRRIRLQGGPMIFSGPLTPPMLGAAVASARIHVSPEIYDLQARLNARVDLLQRLLRESHVPFVEATKTPIRFIAVGAPQPVAEIVREVMEAGFFVQGCAYPAVPIGRAGIRIFLSASHSERDVEGLIDVLAHAVPKAFKNHGTSREEVQDLFANVLL